MVGNQNSRTVLGNAPQVGAAHGEAYLEGLEQALGKTRASTALPGALETTD